jgi:pimeloyl-ACP methyl ester carboxylesterase
MPELRQIATEPGLVFDAMVDGPTNGAPVLLLHGFAESFHMWREQLPAFAAAGYRAVAPSQRGYSASARPSAGDIANYQFDLLVGDAMAIMAADGHVNGRFHLAGHDWGASVAWGLADRYPDRIASLTVLSRPHPSAFNRALQFPDGEQKRRSGHHWAFLEPDAVTKVLADDARWLRERWRKAGVSEAAMRDYLSVLGNEAAMAAALAWYRARGAIRAPLGVIRVPVLYVWGDADDTVGRTAAEGTRDFVSGPYRFETLPGVGHFIADVAPKRVNELMLAHFADHPV